MSKLAIVFCAVLFASAANGAYGSEVEIAKKQAEQDLADASIIIDRRNYLSDPEARVHDKAKVLAALLWKDVREFLQNDNIDQDTKNKLMPLLGEVDNYLQANLEQSKDNFERCPNFGSEAQLIRCYKNYGFNAIEVITKRLPELINKVNELSEADCKKKCERPQSHVSVFVRPKQ